MPERRRLTAVAGEFSVIVVSVFVALAADSWYQSWSETRGFEGYLDRLVVDLTADSMTFHRVLDGLSRKDDNLNHVGRVALGLQEVDSTFFAALEATQAFSFNTPGTQRATFDDLVATGNLRLIEDPVLRTRIAGYYTFVENQSRRIEARRTEYPQALYRLSPVRWRTPDFESQYPRMAREALDSIQTPSFLNLL